MVGSTARLQRCNIGATCHTFSCLRANPALHEYDSAMKVATCMRPFVRIVPTCMSLRRLLACLPLECFLLAPVSVTTPAWLRTVPQVTNKEQRKMRGLLLDGDPAALRLRDNQSSQLRWVRLLIGQRSPCHGRPEDNRDKESNSLFASAIMAVPDSSCGTVGDCDLSLSKSMPVEQEACKTLPRLSPRCLPFSTRCRHCQHLGCQHPHKRRRRRTSLVVSSSRDSCGSEPCQTQLRVTRVS